MRVIQRAAQTVHVRMEVLAFAFQFLRGHVINRSHDVFSTTYRPPPL